MIYKRIPNEENLGSSLVVLLFDLVWKMGFDNVASIPTLVTWGPRSHISATSYVKMLFPEQMYIREVSVYSSHECSCMLIVDLYSLMLSVTWAET